MKHRIDAISGDLESIRAERPLVHNITNYVVMNVTANALLSLGASPVMAHAPEEVEEMVGMAKALVVNIGTLSEPWVASMKRAMRAADDLGIPVVLDPVGVGATGYRTQTAKDLLETISVRLIRANAAEVLALAGETSRIRGVDSLADASDAVASAISLCERYGCAVCISGAIDRVVDRNGVTSIANGHPLMGRVTGMGCCATALCGAFLAVNTDSAAAAIHAMAVMGVAGEVAAERAMGPGTFSMHFFDALYTIEADDLAQRLRLIEQEGYLS